MVAQGTIETAEAQMMGALLRLPPRHLQGSVLRHAPALYALIDRLAPTTVAVLAGKGSPLPLLLADAVEQGGLEGVVLSVGADTWDEAGLRAVPNAEALPKGGVDLLVLDAMPPDGSDVADCLRTGAVVAIFGVADAERMDLANALALGSTPVVFRDGTDLALVAHGGSDLPQDLFGAAWIRRLAIRLGETCLARAGDYPARAEALRLERDRAEAKAEAMSKARLTEMRRAAKAVARNGELARLSTRLLDVLDTGSIKPEQVKKLEPDLALLPDREADTLRRFLTKLSEVSLERDHVVRQTADLAALAAEAARLQDALAGGGGPAAEKALKAAKAREQEFIRSTSWRITRPLRVIARGLRRITGRRPRRT